MGLAWIPPQGIRTSAFLSPQTASKVKAESWTGGLLAAVLRFLNGKEAFSSDGVLSPALSPSQNATQENGVPNQIASPQTAGLQSQAKKPFQTGSAHPPRSSRPDAGVVLEQGAHAPSDGDSEPLGPTVHPFLLSGDAHSRQQHAGPSHADLVGDDFLVAFREETMVGPCDRKPRRLPRPGAGSFLRQTLRAAKQKQAHARPGCGPAEVQDEVSGIHPLRDGSAQETSAPHDCLAVGINEMAPVQRLAIPRVLGGDVRAVGVEVGNSQRRPVRRRGSCQDDARYLRRSDGM